MKLVLHVFVSYLFSVSVTGQGLIINTGASLTSFNGNLTVTEDLTNNGTLSAVGGTFVFAGSDQLINGSSISAFNNITVVSGSTATIQSPQKVSGNVLVNGSLNSNGFLTLVSTPSRTALVDGSGTGQISGNVTMERFLASEFGYKYLSSPFQAATVDELSDDIDLASYTTDVYSYDESRVSSGWVDYKSGGNIFEPMHGYAVNVGESAVPDTLDMVGIVNNGLLSIVLNNNNRIYTKGFNLIGNPYPSPIDWYAASGWVKNNIDDALYYFKASSSDQYGGSYSTLTGGISSDGIASNIIPSMQGFFVHVSDGAYPVAGSIQMDNNVRVVNQSQTFMKKSSAGTPLIRFSAGFSDAATVDNAVIYFDSKATLEFDSQLDALKLMNTDINVPNMYFITPADRNLQIYALPPVFETLCRIPLGLRISREGNVVIKIKDIDVDYLNLRLYITDAVAGTEHDLIPDKEYKILLGSGVYENRFFLNFSEDTRTPDIITSTPENKNSPGDFKIYYSGETLHTETSNQGAAGSLTISNLLGQTLYTTRVYDDGYHEFNIHLKDGIYIATFTTGNTRISKKIPIRN